ncbi:MAG: peptide-methionine (R)-S-oxide reductase MsrB [Rhizobiaceae bacterium]
MNRRLFLGTTFLATIAGLAAVRFSVGSQALAAEGVFEIQKTDEEWRAILSEAQFRVLRKEDTERPFSSALNDEKRTGNFHCAGCDLPVYGSYAKYDSGTGWPSFYESLKGAIGTKEDNSLFSTRTEVHCRRCGGHFGHVFDDGPKPTGMRHCLNGLALTFKPEAA